MKYDQVFIVLGVPKPQLRARSSSRSRHFYDPSKANKEAFLAKAMMFAPDKPYNCPLQVDAIFGMPRPKTHYRTGQYSHLLKPNIPHLHTKKPDEDNLGKFVKDALKGFFWEDDRIICKSNIEKYYCQSPRVVIAIKKLVDEGDTFEKRLTNLTVI